MGLLLHNLREVILGHFGRICNVVESAVLVLSVICIIMINELLAQEKVMET